MGKKSFVLSIVTLLLIAGIGFLFITGNQYGKSKQIKAASPNSIGLTTGTLNNMNYGIATKYMVPFVNYKDIGHIYGSIEGGQLQQGSTTAPFSLVTDISYSFNNASNKNKYELIESSGVMEGNTLRYKGLDYDPSLEVEMVLSPNETWNGVKHEWFIKNTSNEVKKIYPIKQVDTMLGPQDFIPIYSRGVDKGLYMDGDGYRLNYATDVPGGPLLYAGGRYYNPYSSMFGSSLASQTNDQHLAPQGTVLSSLVDTGIFLSWKEQVLQPGETFHARYDVSLSLLSDLSIEKTAENQHAGGINHVGDLIDYAVKVSGGDGYASLSLTDTLPSEMASPTRIQLKKADGSKTDLTVSEVYDQQSHSINVTVPEGIQAEEEISLLYTVEIKAEALNKTLVNKAEALGTDETTISKVETKHQLYVEEQTTGKVIVQYVDNNQVELEASEVLEGDLGAPYASNPKEIPGYELVEVVGETEGTFKQKEQVVQYVYRQLGRVTVMYLDEVGTVLQASKEIEGFVGDLYHEEVPELEGYRYMRVEGNPEGMISGNPQTVKFIYEEHRFELIQEVMKADGSKANEVFLGENLQYQVHLNSLLGQLDPEVYYNDFFITTHLDVNLGEPTEIQLKTEDGMTAGTGVYNAHTHTIVGTLNVSINQSENLVLSYQANVKDTVAFDTLIKGKAKASGNYTNGMIASEKESNEVLSKVKAGELIFESAPVSLTVGGPVKISSKEEVYPLQASGKLSVKDLRGKGQRWSITAKMLELLTNSNGDELGKSLYYTYNGNEQVMGLEASALIYNWTTESSSTVHVSDSWESDETMPFIKVKGGQTKKGEYQGTIQWTLQDVPSGMEEKMTP